MPDVKERLERDADALLLRELLRLTDVQFDEVLRQLMIELKVEPRMIRNRPTYYFAEVVSTRDQNREILFVNKGTGVIGIVDVEKLAIYAEKVRAPRSLLITIGEVSKEAEKEGRKKNVKLMTGKELAALIRKSALEGMILQEFAQDETAEAPPSEEETLRGETIMGAESLEKGDPVIALEHFDRAIAADPGSDTVWRLKGNALDQLGHHERALECYARALELNQQSAELWYSVGASMYHLGRYEDEIQAYDKALQIDPRQEDAMLNKGSTLLKTHKYKEAIEAFNALLKVNPRIVKAHSDRGIALRHLGRTEEAIGAFESALSLDPEYAEAWSNKGSILIQLGRFDEALTCFENLVNLRPDSASAWKAKGELEARLGKDNEAIDSFEAVLEIEPTNVEAKRIMDAEKMKLMADRSEVRDKIASLFFSAGLDVQPEPVWEEPAVEAQEMRESTTAEEASETVSEMVEAAEAASQEAPKIEEMVQRPVVPDDLLALDAEGFAEPMLDVAEDVFGDSADLMLLMKKPDLALEEADKGLRLEPTSVRMTLLRGTALHALGKNEEALKAFVRAAEIEPGREDAVFSIEHLLSSMGKFSEAEESLEPLLDGKHWVPEILAAMDSFQAGKIKEVREHMESAISLAPSAMAWNYKGLLELDQGDFERSIETFSRAREMEAVFSDPSNNTGVAYSKLGSTDDASNWYDVAISAQPRNSTAWSNRGVLLANLKRYKEALACFDQSLLLQADSIVMINKGFTQLSMDSLEEALASFESSLSIKETAEGFNNKGIVLARMKRFNEAVRCFRRAAEIASDFTDAKKNLEQYEKLATPEKKGKGTDQLPYPPRTPDDVWKMLGSPDEDSLNRMRKSEVDEICEALGLSTDGSKKELVERILAVRPRK